MGAVVEGLVLHLCLSRSAAVDGSVGVALRTCLRGLVVCDGFPLPPLWVQNDTLHTFIPSAANSGPWRMFGTFCHGKGLGCVCHGKALRHVCYGADPTC